MTPPLDGRFGGLVVALANLANVPVLIARAPSADETIVAATDLQAANYPVLRQAAQLAEQIDASLVALHNVPPPPMSARTVTRAATFDSAVESQTEDRRRRLERATSELQLFAEAVVSHEANSADAILREARARDADVVVVGARRPSWFERLRRGSVPSRVVDRARRSVLVTPIGDHRSNSR